MSVNLSLILIHPSKVESITVDKVDSIDGIGMQASIPINAFQESLNE